MRRSLVAALTVVGLVTTMLVPVVALQHEVAAVAQRIEHRVESRLFGRICTATLERMGRAQWARWCDPQRTVRERLRTWSRDRLGRAVDRLRSRGRVTPDWETRAERVSGDRAVEDTDPSHLDRDVGDVVREEGGGSAAEAPGETPATAPPEAEVDLRVATGQALEGEALADTVTTGTEALDVVDAGRFAVGRGSVIGNVLLAAFSVVSSAWDTHRRQQAGPLYWSPDDHGAAGLTYEGDIRWALESCRLPDLLWALGQPKALLAWSFWYDWRQQLSGSGAASVRGDDRDILDWRLFTPPSCPYASDQAATQAGVDAAFADLERRSSAVDRAATRGIAALTLDDLTGFLGGLEPRGGDLGGLEDVVLALEQPRSIAHGQLVETLRQGQWVQYERLHELALSPMAAGVGGPGARIQGALDAAVRECGCPSPVPDPPAAVSMPVDETTASALLLAMADVLGGDDVATDPHDGSEVQTRVGPEGNAGLFGVLPSEFETSMTEAGDTRAAGHQVDTSVSSQALAAAQLLADDLQRRRGDLSGALAEFVHDNRLPPWDAAWPGMRAPDGWEDLLRTRDGRAAHLPTATLLAAVARDYALYLTAPQDDSSGGDGTRAVAVRGPLAPLFGWVPAGGYPDAFPFGQCTYWAAYNVRVTWNGNARDWLANARAQGYATGDSPSVGSIVVWQGGPYDPVDGHVGVVIAVSGDGYRVSEMNFIGTGVVDTRWVHSPDRDALGYITMAH